MLNTSKWFVHFFLFVFFKKIDFDSDPEMNPDLDLELPEKSGPDTEIIFSDPTHCSGTEVPFSTEF